MSLLPHCEVCDLAKLTMLVYEYGKTFTLDKDTTIESFVGSMSERSLDIKSPVRIEVMKELAETSPHGKVHKFFSVEETDLQVGITLSETHKRITVVFRGSESSYDWYYDLSFFKKNLHDNVWVHGGFYKQLHEEDMYENIKKEVLELLEEYPDYEVFVTGHSLGAALSTLFGYELSRDIENQVSVVSFASPRVGNPAFRTHFDNQENLIHYRVSNHRDVITAAPMINYQHVGINIALSDDACKIFRHYDYNSWYAYSLFRCWSVKDHDIDLYYQRLKKNSW